MAGINYADLERRSYGQKMDQRGLELTPEILGKIILLTWILERGEGYGSSLPRDPFEFLIDSLNSWPNAIKKILHIEHRADGPHIEELTLMIVGAQASGAIGRLNPKTVQPVARADIAQAGHMLTRYSSLFPDVVDWTREMIRPSSQT